jgi:hypothetical protein
MDIKLGHDVLIGAILIIAALISLLYASRGAVSFRMASVLGCVATAVIGVLLVFSLV